MQKLLMVIKVKPEFKEDYVNIHLNPWKEMLQALKEAGFINELIWYYDNQSIIYFECEDDDYNNTDARVRATDVCKKWDIMVKPWFAAEPAIPEKIFDLNEMLVEK